MLAFSRVIIRLVLASAVGACGGSSEAPPAPITSVPPILMPRAADAVVTPLANDPVLYVASQDGTAAWTNVTPAANGTYPLQYPSGRGAVAIVDTSAGSIRTSVYYLAVSQFATTVPRILPFDGPCTAPRTLRIAVKGASAPNRRVNISGPTGGTTSVGDTSGLTFSDCEPDTTSVIATLTDIGATVANKIVLLSGVRPNTTGQLPIIDFSSASAITPDSVPLTASSPDGAVVASTMYYIGNIATPGIATVMSSTSGAGSSHVRRVPAARRVAGDVHLLASSASTGTSRRSELSYITAPDAALSVRLSATVPNPTLTVLAGAAFRPRMQVLAQPEYPTAAMAFYVQPRARQLFIYMSAAYRGNQSATAWDLTFPDLTTLPGWRSTWAMGAGQISWSATLMGGAPSASLELLRDQVTRSASTYGTIVN